MAQRAVWPHEAIHPEQAGELADRMYAMDLNPATILLVHHGDPALRENDLPRQPLEARLALPRPHRTAPAHLGDPRRGRRCLGSAPCSPGRAASWQDGHHRYAAYLRLQEEHPGTAWDAGLAMLVDQDDTPLFLGAIHRTLPGTTLESLTATPRKPPARS